ncbi:hypothetical protein ACEXQE_07530 [Herbiconiux sp. P17]|uniref:hypothetical protein n=1 Tax=Herbiconiux wuyangfengii TaxID=3342794 RepID=UPI0035BAA73D
MKVQPGDERDTAWERVESVFRVFFYSGDGPFTTQAHDLSDTTFMEALAWAEQSAGKDRLFSIALLAEDSYGAKGLVWLVGIDANSSPHDTVERRLYNELDRQPKSFIERGRRARM